MNAPRHRTSHPTRLFAWDGVSFLIPETWDLASYSFTRNITSVVLEDDYSVRLEAEWIRPRRELDIQKIQARYTKSARKLTQTAERTTQLKDLPTGWTAFLYTMANNQKLLTALFIAEASKLFCIVRIHFGSDDRENPRPILKLIADNFRIHQGQTVPWTVYDVSFELSADFRLVNTSLQAGRKLFTFDWRLRRLYIWFFSLANMVVKDRPLEQWACEFLNSFKGIKGPTFVAAGTGQLRARRTWPYRFGHFEEIGRWCFRYRAGCTLDQEKNRIILWVYHYRRKQDLTKLPDSII